MNLKSLAGVVLLTASTVSSHAALVAHYTFDETSGTTAADSAGGDQNATTNQGTVSWVAGKIGGAVSMNGTASMQAMDALGPGTTAFTISAWVNLNELPAYKGIFSARNVNWGLNINQLPASAGPAFDYRFANTGGAGSQGLDSDANSAVIGQWTHLAMTWEGNGTTMLGEIFLNGVKLTGAGQSTTTAAATYPTWGANDRWNIGDDPCCGGRELNALYDDIAVWNEKLTDGQIAQIFAGGNAGLNAAAAIPEPGAPVLGLFGALLVFLRRRRA